MLQNNNLDVSKSVLEDGVINYNFASPNGEYSTEYIKDKDNVYLTVSPTYSGQGLLSESEILNQIFYVIGQNFLEAETLNKFQVTFFNLCGLDTIYNLHTILKTIKHLEGLYPKMNFVIATSGVEGVSHLYTELFKAAQRNTKIGLQFIVLHSDKESKIGEDALTNTQISDCGRVWNYDTLRRSEIRYMVNQFNCSETDLKNLIELFPKNLFYFFIEVTVKPDFTLSEKIMNFIRKICIAGYVFNVRGIEI